MGGTSSGARRACSSRCSETGTPCSTAHSQSSSALQWRRSLTRCTGSPRVVIQRRTVPSGTLRYDAA